MAIPARPPPPESSGGFFSRDPVRIAWVCYGFVQATVIVLLATDVLSQRWAAIISGIGFAIYVAVSELYVRPQTVPREPLEELANGKHD